jgi:hypothetical protein
MPKAFDAAAVTEKPRPGFRLGCLGLCVCTFLAFVALWIGLKLAAVHALNAETDSLRANGEPVTWAEVLDSIEPIRAGENSALLLLRDLTGLSAWEDPPAGGVVVVRPSADLGVRRSDEMTRLMRVSLVDGSAALKLLHAAADRPSGRWPVDPDPLVHNDSLGHLAEIRSSTRLLDVEVELRAADGDGHAAAQSVRAMRRLAAALDGSPDLIAALVRIAVDKMSAGAAEYALSLTELSATDLAMLRDEFAAEAEQLGFLSAARGERALWFWMATDGRHELIDELGGGNALVTFYSMLPGVVERDAMLVLDYMSSWVELLKLPPRDLQTGMALRSDKYDPILSNHIGRPARRSLALLSPAIWRGTEALLATKLRLHIARTALAVEQFRRERGRWPAKLADLVPDYLEAVPEDWFAPPGTGLSYAHTPAGARVWSFRGRNALGLASEEWEKLQNTAAEISAFAAKEGRLPRTLDELPADGSNADMIDPRTREPWSYVTSPVNPDLLILGGFTGGVSEKEFWKQTMTTQEWAQRHATAEYPLVFRLLDPKLRGVVQSRFAEEVRPGNHAMYLHGLGYTRERLKALGFSDSDVNDYDAEIKALEAGGWEPTQTWPLGSTDVPADTQTEARP